MYGFRKFKPVKKLNPYTITMPDFTKFGEDYEGSIVGSWKDRRIEIVFTLRHEVRTVSGFSLNWNKNYGYLPAWGQDVWQALQRIMLDEIREALLAAGWGETDPALDVDNFYGWRSPPSIWRHFLNEEYRYHRV